MTPFDLDTAGAVLRAGVADGQWPGLVAAAGVGDRLDAAWVLGRAVVHGAPSRAMSAGTVFDLASLTKVLATLPAVLVLVRDGRVGLDDHAVRWLPGLDPRITVAQLLSHSSGLPAHVDLAPGCGPGEASAASLVAAAASTAPVRAPGTAVAYSDLGFVLLGGLVAALDGSLEGSVQANVLDPLASSLTYSAPDDSAATEVFGGAALTGRVHDENAASAGEPVGHAGLFGTLAGVRACLPMWWPGGPVLPDWLRSSALRDRTAGLPDTEVPASGPPAHMWGPDAHRGLGWTCRGDRQDILSPGWGAGAVSHTGFTGTSVALDPSTQRWAILLTNAVHFGRGRPAVFAARRHFHAALVGDTYPPPPSAT